MVTEKKKLDFEKLSGLSRTMLITLASRGLADEIVPELEFQDIEAKALLQHLPDSLITACSVIPIVKPIAMRAKLIDQLAMDFFQKHSRSIGVGLGSGLCTRELRIKSYPDFEGQFEWFDVDLPEVIDIRRKIFPLANSIHLIACSITENQWIDRIGNTANRPFLLVLEGVVSYLTLSQNKKLFQYLEENFGPAAPHVEVIFDYMHPELTGSKYTQNKVDGDSLPFQSGFENIDEVLNFNPRLSLIAEFNYFSQISPFHASFENQFRVEHDGNSPYAVAHLGIN